MRVAAFVEAGHSCRVARHFGVSDSCAIKLMQRRRQFGSLAPALEGRPPGRGKLVPYEAFLIQTVEAVPAITMPELAARLLEQHGIIAAPRCSRAFRASSPSSGPASLISSVGFVYLGVIKIIQRHDFASMNME